MQDDVTIGGGDLARLAQWKAEQENTPRPLPAAAAEEIRRRQTEIARLNGELVAYLHGIKDTLGQRTDHLEVNTDNMTYTLRSAGA